MPEKSIIIIVTWKVCRHEIFRMCGAKNLLGGAFIVKQIPLNGLLVSIFDALNQNTGFQKNFLLHYYKSPPFKLLSDGLLTQRVGPSPTQSMVEEASSWLWSLIISIQQVWVNGCGYHSVQYWKNMGPIASTIWTNMHALR